MEYEEIHGLYVGKPLGDYHVIAMLSQKQNLRVDCIVSDGNIWRFHIGFEYPDLKIEEVENLRDMKPKWIGGRLAYYTVKIPIDYYQWL